MQKATAVLFDLDGTLLDTARDLGNALNHVLDSHGLQRCTYEQYRPVASHGSLGLLKLGFGDRLNDDNLEPLRKQFLDFYNDNLCVDTCTFGGVDDLIASLDRLSIPWGIVTNKPGWLTDSLLPNFKQFKNCKAVVSGDTLEQRKPHPAPLLHAAEILGVDHRSIWYVGDAERDIQAANAAEMVSVVADYGYISDQDMPHQWGADMHIADAKALVNFL